MYRLTIGALPLVTHVFPLGWQRNSETPVSLFGVNLPTDKLTLKLPSDCPSRVPLEVSAGGLTSNAISFAVDDLPEKFETEPNNAVEQANRIEFPANVNGRIQQPGDVDHFIFAATKGQKIVIDVRARRLDSPLDSIVTLYNATGQQLAENDDTQDLSEGLVTHHADSYLAYTIPADGDYVIRLADVQSQGGEEYGYRLTLTPPRPDFQLRIQPDSPRAAQGSTAMFTVNAFRQDGCIGEIKLSVKGLPEGFIAPDEIIPEKQNQTRMTISAPLTAPIGIFPLKVVGTGADERAKAEYEVADKAAKEAETAAKTAKTAADKAATAQATADKAAATKRQQADDAKKKRDNLVQNQQKTAETNLAAAVQAVTDATRAKPALDKALAEAKAAIPNTQQAVDAAEKAAQAAAAVAKTVSADVGKSQEEKKKAADDAVAKRKVADEAKTALSQSQQKQQQAQAQADAAGQNRTRAETQKKSAGQALANIKTQAAAATNAYPPAEKAAKDAEAAAATAKASTDKAAAAQAAAEKVAPDKRKLADEVKGKLSQTIVREALPSEDLMQAFYFMHTVPCQECLLAVVERGPFALILDLPPKQVLKLPRLGRVELVVKANFKEGVQPGEIVLKPDRIPREWQIETPPIAVGQTQTTITISTFGNQAIFQGQTGSLVINASMKVGNQTVYGFVPSIPYEVQ
ncbi:MAG: hypothetical protein NTY19_01010 [Planctomycetota bacterium]|nr:hypothetical protein [Planctomycetota bacterium]